MHAVVLLVFLVLLGLLVFLVLLELLVFLVLLELLVFLELLENLLSLTSKMPSLPLKICYLRFFLQFFFSISW